MLGNFRAAFGLGLVMDNTDFIHFRKTGYGWNKRPLGVRGDLSRSREYALNGAAVEGTLGPVNVAVFGSTRSQGRHPQCRRTVNRYITMLPRPSPEFLDSDTPGRKSDRARRATPSTRTWSAAPCRSLVAPGTYVGVTGYEARYNSAFDPDHPRCTI